jgi:general secretion pathway protein G
MHLKMIKRRQGFTLMELLITMGIIVLLMGVGVVSYTQTNKKARDSKRKADIESIRSALELYRTDQGQYPALTINGSNCITSTAITSGAVTYLAKIPTDTRDDGVTYCYKYLLGASPFTTYEITCTFEDGSACSYINP